MPRKRTYPKTVEIDFDAVKPIIEKAMEKPGDMVEMSRAVGALILGQVMGWKVLRIALSRNTYAKYEKLLDIKFKDVCLAETPYTARSIGYSFIQDMTDFWDAIRRGSVPPEDRKMITDSSS